LYILREKVTFSGGDVWGGLMYTVIKDLGASGPWGPVPTCN